MLFTLGRGNFVHLETIVRHVSRPRLPKDKRDAIAVNIASQLGVALCSCSIDDSLDIRAGASAEDFGPFEDHGPRHFST